ncbi:MAG TPA: SIMPL domain-containing protein [Acidobacteriaceae bacterium]
MRLTFAVLGTFLLTASVVSAQNTSAPSLQISKDNRTITVSSTGHAEADSEIAEIHIGYTVYGATLPAAYKSASDTSNAIVKAMLDAGAQKSEIQSQSQNVTRLQEYEMKTQKGMKFSVQQSWTVSVAPKDAAVILDAAIQAGANQSGDINWRMKDNSVLDDEAIRRATERAHSTAAEMAKSMGVTLGKPLYATNSINVLPLNGRQMFAYSAGVAASAERSVAPLTIESQRVASTANVEIVYSIE